MKVKKFNQVKLCLKCTKLDSYLVTSEKATLHLQYVLPWHSQLVEHTITR